MRGANGPEGSGGGGTRPPRPRCGFARTGPRRFEKKRGLGCVLAALLLLQCGRPVEVGQRAPDFILADLKGGSVSLDGLRGKLVFLHFWATWCPPCLVELPGLMRFVDGLDKTAYALLAVCVDNEPPERIGEFLRSWGAAIPVYLDPGGSLARRFGTFRFPETYVLDPEGRVCSKVIGMGDWEISKWAHVLHACAVKANPVTRGVESGS